MGLLTRPITATFLLLAMGCTGGRGPTPAAAPEVDPPADPAADPPTEPTADPPTNPAADPPADSAAATTPALPTCGSWSEWNFFEAASGARVCLQAGTDLNALVEDGHTILRRAATYADTELPLRLLVRREAEGALRAATYADAELPLRLLALRADPNARYDWGETPPYRAAGAGDPQAIRALLEAGADPRALTDRGESALHAAARRRLPHTPEVITLLADAGLDVNARNAKGQTPLRLARTHDNLPAMRKLLELGADPEARDSAGRVAVSACVWDGGWDVRGWDFLAASPVESIRGCIESGIPVDARHEEGATPLTLLVSTRVCCTDFKNVLREFVAASADVNARDDRGRTPLHRAGPTIVTSALLEAGADPGATDSAGSTPMHIAASRGRGAKASLLAAAGADVKARDNRGRTPLHLARDPATIRTLLQLGADPAALDSAGTVADPAACARWGSEAFFAFATADIVAGCIADGADVHTTAAASWVPALVNAAASTPDPAVVSILLEAGADVHARHGFWQDTPLHHAARSGTSEVVRALLAAGADVDARDDRNQTPLHHAARSGTSEVVRALLAAGADVDAWAKGYAVDWGWGWTPLHLAAKSNPDPEVVRALVEAGAELHALGEESYYHGNTPLHYAGDNPNPEVAAALLSADADVNALSATGRTPLHEAAANAPNPAVIEILVAAGANVNALDSKGYAPLHSAAWYNPRPEIATALIAAGADINARDPDGSVPPGRAANGRTPLLMALYRGGAFIAGQPMPTVHSLAVVEVLVRAGAKLEEADESGLTALHMAAIWTPAAFPLLLRVGADPNARDAGGKTPWDHALGNPSLQGVEEVRRMREEMWRGGAEP